MEEYGGLSCRTSRRRRVAFLRPEREGGGFVLRDAPLEGRVEWNVRAFDIGSRGDA